MSHHFTPTHYRILLPLFLLAAALSAQQQPIPYSHKTHLALGLKCNSCHKNPDPGETMGFPAESFCMSCHRTVKSDSPHIARLAAAAKDKQPLPWVRVYQLPPNIYVSHRVHTQAGATCETCHGPVKDRDLITKEISHNMSGCMACHATKIGPQRLRRLPRRALTHPQPPRVPTRRVGLDHPTWPLSPQPRPHQIR